MSLALHQRPKQAHSVKKSAYTTGSPLRVVQKTCHDFLLRNARVLVAVRDNIGSQPADNQLLDRALAAVVSRGAKQFMVTPLEGDGGGRLFQGLFGGGGGGLLQEAQQG